MKTEAGLRSLWQHLEALASMRSTPTKRCRYCDREAPGPLCLVCDTRRRELGERFGGFRVPADVAATVDELERQVERPADESAVRINPRTEWLPYRDSE